MNISFHFRKTDPEIFPIVNHYAWIESGRYNLKHLQAKPANLWSFEYFSWYTPCVSVHYTAVISVTADLTATQW